MYGLGASSGRTQRLEEISKAYTEVLQILRSRKALNAVANGLGPHQVGDASQKNMMGAPAKVAGKHFGVPEELDPSNASILHMAHPRSSEVAMVMAEHARWAQREAMKALYLAASDSNQASEAAQQSMRQPNASFPVYAEKPLPMEPWSAAERWPTDPPDPLRTMPMGNTPPGVHLERLAEWFRLHPRPPEAEPVERIEVKQPPPGPGEMQAAPGSPGANGYGPAPQAGAAAPGAPGAPVPGHPLAEFSRPWTPHRAPAPVPYLSGNDPYISKPPPPPNPDDDLDPSPDRKIPPSPGQKPPPGGTPPKLEPPADKMGMGEGCLAGTALIQHVMPRLIRTRRHQTHASMKEFLGEASSSIVAF
eukprot:CAMPEP_0181496254 /NCGR_PEP_ID=MMETSP1110-20121109/52866_1 /TAXON_ID=174948 /ORGANISM="Symbiodinium sp., Strain CCMP421" /LENGTH=361 /DNA_ID=CAMNT_0023624039 /DNA_START=12 /DNA_END=1097 /DNA_ORIENTATION=+